MCSHHQLTVFAVTGCALLLPPLLREVARSVLRAAVYIRTQGEALAQAGGPHTQATEAVVDEQRRTLLAQLRREAREASLLTRS